MNPVIWVVIYLLIINIYLYFTMLADKGFAKKRKRRVPERHFFLVSILGGSIGCLLGMYQFRHKTKHLSFTMGIPVIIFFQLALIIYLIGVFN